MDTLQTLNSNLTQLNLDVIEIMHIDKTTIPLSYPSKAVYFGIGRQYNEFLHLNNLTVSPESIKQFIYSREWQSATRNLKIIALVKLITNQPAVRGNFLLIATIKEAIRQNIRRVRINKAITRTDYLTEDEINEIISKNKNKIGLMMEFMFKTGCRISEMLDIKLIDITYKNRIAEINVLGKGLKERYVYIPKVIIDEIRNEFNSNRYLFDTKKHTKFDRSNIWKDVKKAGLNAGYPFIYPHIFRHSCAMHLKHLGKDAKYTQKYLGHFSINVTIEHYYHDLPEPDDVIELFS